MELVHVLWFGVGLLFPVKYPSAAPEVSKKCHLGRNVDCDCSRRGRYCDAAAQVIYLGDYLKHYNGRLLPEMTQRTGVGVDSVDDDTAGSFLFLLVLHRKMSSVAVAAVLYEGVTSEKLRDDAPNEMTMK